jgi:pimeloyl-ACP methyl ester carboxylesterase
MMHRINAAALRGLAGAASMLAAVALAAPEPATPYGKNPAAGHFAEVNGIRLHYELYGSGAPLVMMHGNGGDISAMRFQIEYFKSRRQVIAVDSRGHGQSEMGAGRLTYTQMADDVAALLDELHAGPADLLGWSDGGIVALLVALRHPAEVRSITISGANLTPGDLKPSDIDSMKSDLAHADRKIAAGDKTRDWARDRQYLQLMITQPQIRPADLARIRIPALVLAGERDMIPEPHTRLIAACLPNSQLHIFLGAGHGALMEVPDRFNSTVDAFLGSLR